MAHLNRSYSVTKNPGVYTMILQVKENLSLRIGSLGQIDLGAGKYLYTGSALGSGGLDSRLARHLRKEKRVFWHIDYLTVNRYAAVRGLVKARCLRRMECSVNSMLLSQLSVMPIPRFGSSDCGKCSGHLLWAGDTGLDVLIKSTMRIYLELGMNPASNIPSGEGYP